MSEAEDASSGKGSNLTAVEAISARLAEVTRLAEKLDAKLCEAGARTRPVPMSSSAVSSSTSSLLSSSNAPPSSQTHPISALTTSSIGITAPLITSSTVQLQPKCVSTILSSATSNENVGKECTTKESVENGTGVGGERMESKAEEKAETGEECRQDDLSGMIDEKLKGEVAEVSEI